MQQQRLVSLLCILVTLVAYCTASCTNGVANGGSGCFCFDKFGGATCTAISELSGCTAAAAENTVTPAAPTLGGGINGDDFRIIVNFSPLVASRYVSKISFLASNGDTAFDYPTGSWDIEGVTTGCKKVYSISMNKDAAQTAGVFTVDKSDPNVEKYTGVVYVTAVDVLEEGVQRTISYRLQYSYSFPVASVTTVQAAKVVSDLDVSTQVTQITLVSAKDDGSLEVSVKVGTKYPYILDWVSNLREGGVPVFAGDDVTTSVGVLDVVAKQAPATCTNTANQLCYQDFVFIITPDECNSADGEYTINAVVTKCVGDAAGESCVKTGATTYNKKAVAVVLDISFGDLCGPETVFEVEPGNTLAVHANSARDVTKPRFVEGVDGTLYFSTTFAKKTGTDGFIGSVSLNSVDTRCISAGCAELSTFAPIADASIGEEVTATLGRLLFNLPITLFLHDPTATSYQFEWEIRATAVVYFSTDAPAKRQSEVVEVRAILANSVGSSALGQFAIVRNDTESQTIPTPAPTLAPATIIVVNAASEGGLGIVGIVGIVVGAVCFSGLVIVLLVLLARRNKKQKERLNEEDAATQL